METLLNAGLVDSVAFPEVTLADIPVVVGFMVATAVVVAVCVFVVRLVWKGLKALWSFIVD